MYELYRFKHNLVTLSYKHWIPWRDLIASYLIDVAIGTTGNLGHRNDLCTSCTVLNTDLVILSYKYQMPWRDFSSQRLIVSYLIDVDMGTTGELGHGNQLCTSCTVLNIDSVILAYKHQIPLARLLQSDHYVND